MRMALLDDFVGNLLETVTGQKEKGWNLVVMRKPTEKLLCGDFSFPTDFRIWRKCLQIRDDFSGDIFAYRRVSPEEIVQKSADAGWSLPVEKVEVLKNRCVIFLNRSETFKRVIKHTLESDLEFPVKEGKKTIFLEEIQEASDTLTDYRGILLRDVFSNLLKRSRKFTQVLDRTNADISYVITSKSSAEVIPGMKRILPGVVLDAKTGKKSSSVAWTQCLEEKVRECELVARHRYGFRGPGDSQFENLGRATLCLEMLEAKPTSPVAFGGSSSRGGAFILYNSARMETLLETFKARNFPEAPKLEDVDFGMLSESEEWVILLNFIIGEEWMIEKSLCELELGRISPHLVCSFLQSLVTVFSAYYRRVQILTDNRQHLLTTIHARIVLLRALRKVFNRTLAVLNISPVAKM
ncbi:uncharacterized protein LOC132256861 [Phlebotomus argentipes]|uniref:uncharacterized protein LOC132256861 n=1 Tax=Phlebotomus argentipes TaxID=94469 RepID=UPI0028935611|nr:uncharacterized protein LOC132256861 [Phlebotomus argentipes]